MNPLKFLDGKKTTIACGMLVASAFLDQIVLGAWQFASPLLDKSAITLDWFGMVLGGTGLAHKARKALPTKEE